VDQGDKKEGRKLKKRPSIVEDSHRQTHSERCVGYSEFGLKKFEEEEEREKFPL